MTDCRLPVPPPGHRARRAAVVAALAPLVLLLAPPPTAAQVRPFITIPSDPLGRPGRVYVLPVVFVPGDRTHLFAGLETPELDLDGEPMAPELAARSRAAVANLEAHLRSAQEKYRRMLRHPKLQGDAADRGTFALATWDREAGRARPFDPGSGPLVPFVHRGDAGFATYARLGEQGGPLLVAELLDALECPQARCPFILFTVVVRRQTEPGGPQNDGFVKHGGAQALNLGFNGGAGFALFPFHDFTRAHEPDVNTLSTVLHELGHAFGLPHTWEAYGGSTEEGCDDIREPTRYDKWCSDSIMSYNEDNHAFGCLETVPPPGAEPAGSTPPHCVFPQNPAAVAKGVPGTLIPEDLYGLARNQLVFPELGYEDAVELAPAEVRRFAGGPGGVSLPGRPRLRVRIDGCAEAPFLVGNHGRAFLPSGAPFPSPTTSGQMWHSPPRVPGTWVQLDVDLPTTVPLRRLLVATGHSHVVHRAARYRVYDRSGGKAAVCGEGAVTASDQTIDMRCCTTDRLRIELEVGSSSHLVIRGVRLFAADGEELRELFPPLEPVARTDFGEAFASAVASLVGAGRVIAPADAPFDSDHGWHSEQVAPGAWVAFEIEFPDDQALGAIALHTGHSGGLHKPVAVQIERRDGEGTWRFVRRDDTSAAAVHAVDAGGIQAKHWKIALQTGPTGHVVVRGLLFTDADQISIFVP